MRMHEIMGISDKEWQKLIFEIGPPSDIIDAASRQADQLIKQGKLTKKRMAVTKARQQLAAKQSDLAKTQRDTQRRT